MSQEILIPTRVVVFHDPEYPGACSDATLSQLISGTFEVVGASELAEKLEDAHAVLVSFHGPYFPKQSWQAVQHFLERGGHLAIFGGMPFTRPVLPDGTVEVEQQGYTERLYLGPFFELELPVEDLCLHPSPEAAFLGADAFSLNEGQSGTFWSFYPRITQISDHPTDMGSTGPLDTILTPLLFAAPAAATSPEADQRLATPVVLLDQQHGAYKGGRWVLSPWKPSSEEVWLEHATIIQQCIALAQERSVSLDVHPLYACYQPGEAPTLAIASRTRHNLQVHITVMNPGQQELATFEREIGGEAVLQEQRIQLPIQTAPGFYKVKVRYAQGVELACETGFWIWDQALVDQTLSQKLTAGRDYFYQNERPFFLFGTTYMDSRVQRQYLFLPDAARWDADFAEMKRAGINTLRTGIWTAWRDMMPVVGRAAEEVLRAFDAFVMTACKYAIQVIFTFFSFSPPLFEGENPWFDPRSIEGQQDFIASFVRRYKDIQIVFWDLINEPSFGDPAKIFSQRPVPNYDHFELAAFREWLAARYTLSELQVRWRQTPADFASWDEVTLPVDADYATNPRSTEGRKMLKVMDYTLFSQEMFREWARKMREAIHAAGSTTPVGVGQDEAGARISPQFYAPAVDYTTTHPWWNNDDLLWDMLSDKTLETPNVIQEIGVMLVRDIDMRPWRSEQECANLLERKLILGLIARGAGLIQWLWHTNAGMTSDNENSIGLVRMDGSAKPELAAMLEVGRLVREVGNRLVESENVPEVWVIAPYAQWFVRPDLAIEATRRAIRVLGYDLGIVPQVVGDDQLVRLAGTAGSSYKPRVIIVPSVQYFPVAAWDVLRGFAEAGTTVLVSGALSHDQHNLLADFRFSEHNDTTLLRTVPVSRYERLEVQPGETCQLIFSHDKIAYVSKAHTQLRSYQSGAGTIFWSGLPIELSENAQATQRVYRHVLAHNAEAQQHTHTHSVEERPLLMVQRTLREGRLVLLVSESADDSQVTLDTGVEVRIAGNRAGAVIIEHDGRLKFFGGVYAQEH